MCGIVGYIGGRHAAPILRASSEKLEYRGYDSCGIATLSGEGKILVKKGVGRVSEVAKRLDFDSLPGKLGIMHVRWATHGAPNKANAHPHTDCKATIALAHNGVIENYYELMQDLKGHRFTSETDTEVIAHLIEEESKSKSPEDAILSALKKLKGSFALAIIHSGAPDKLFIARRLSPLVVGVGNNEMFCASDMPALLSHTKEFIILHDDEFGILTRGGVEIKTLNGRRVQRKPIRVSWTSTMVEKEGYEHFTLKEIEEQPLAIAQTLGDEQRIDEAASFARIFKKIQVVACGSSYHASLVFKYLVEKLARIPCEVAVGSEYTFGPLHVADGDTLLIGVSQSGETADTLVAMKHAKAKGVKILGLTNTLGSSLTRDSDQVFYTHAGPEISVIATKTFTSQIAALSHLAFELVGRKDLTAELKQSGGMIEKILKMQPELKEISRRLSEKKDFFFIGRGISYPTALEGALKLKEITYKHAEAYPGGELKHGPLSLIEHGVPVIAIAPGDETERKMLGSIKECKARGAQIIAVSDSELILREADVKIRMPAARHELAPLLYVIPLQLMAYYIAVEMKRDPDKPRNLAKSITVE